MPYYHGYYYSHYDYESLAGLTILDILDEVCWRALLDRLDLEYIILSERVSRPWQRVIHKYLQGITFSVECQCCQIEEQSNFRVVKLQPWRPDTFGPVIRKWGPYLKKVHWVHDTIDKDNLEVLSESCPDLEDITMCRNIDPVEDIISELPKKFKKLKRVTFKGRDNKFTDCFISQWIASDTIEELSILGAALATGECLKYLQWTKLKTLSFNYCTALELRYLLYAADHNKKLTKLKLKYMPECIILNLDQLLNKLPDLEDLCLRWISPMVLGNELIESVGGMGRLKRLDLRGNANACDEWLEVVARGCRLEELDVKGCAVNKFRSIGVTGRGVEAVCRASGPAMRSLHVGLNDNILDHHVAAFVAACPNLTFLDLSYNCSLTEQILEVLAVAAARPGSRLRVRVWNTKILRERTPTEWTSFWV